MPRLADKILCSGCGACSQICSADAIVMVPDSEGFLYPCVDVQKCVSCSLCEKVCPVISPFASQKPLGTFALINRNDEIRHSSSSGGAFYALADKVIGAGGIVYGACFDEQWKVFHKPAFCQDEIIPMMGSKYLQSEIGETFSECEKYLREGRRLLYTGTPCQIAGLRHFLRKDYENLLTVDVICHGVPSSKVWRKYLESMAGDVRNVRRVSMRNKDSGWSNYSIVIDFYKGGEETGYRSLFHEDKYMQAFLRDMILRPSCYHCSFKEFRSGSDITIGDYWGIDDVMPEINDNRGVSLVIANTEKGKNAMKELDLSMWQCSFDCAVNGNPALLRSPVPWPRRDYFFSKLDSCKDVSKLIVDSLTPPIGMRTRMKNLLKAILGENLFDMIKRILR